MSIHINQNTNNITYTNNKDEYACSKYILLHKVYDIMFMIYIGMC